MNDRKKSQGSSEINRRSATIATILILLWSSYQAVPVASQVGAQWFAQRARERAAEGDWEGAIDELRSALRMDPSLDEERRLLAAAYFKVGKPKEGLFHLRFLVRKDPSDKKSLLPLAEALEKMGQVNEALTFLSRGYHRAPQDPEIRVHLSRLLIATGRWQEAVEHLKWVLHRVPDYAPGHYHLALFYESQGDWSRALHHALQTVRLARQNPDALFLAFRLSLRNQKDDQARFLARTLRRLFPKDERVLQEIGRTYAEFERWNDAASFLKRAVSVNPKSSETRRLLAEVLMRLRLWPQALYQIQILRKEQPDEPSLLHAYVECLLNLKRREQAIQVLLRWAQLHPKDPKPYLLLARIALEKGDRRLALSAYRRAVFLRPPLEVLAEAAEAEEAYGDPDRALNLYQRIQHRQPENPYWRVKRAELLMRLKKYQSARRVLLSALRKFPDDPSLNALMGLWLARMVRWDEAPAYLVKTVTGPSYPTRWTPLTLEAVGTLVEIYLCQDRWKEAVRLCDRLLLEKPHPNLLIWWAQAMDEGGHRVAAARRLTASASFRSGYLPVVLTVADLWLSANDLVTAQAVWDRWLQQVGKGAQGDRFYGEVARFWLDRNRPTEALAVIEKGLSFWSQSHLLQRLQVEAYLLGKGYAAAVRQAGLLLKAHPNDKWAALLYAQGAVNLWGDAALEKVSALLPAEPHLAKVKEILASHTNSGNLRETSSDSQISGTNIADGFNKRLAELWGKAQEAADRQQWSQALRYARSVLAQNPSFLPAYDLLIEAYSQMKDLDQAVKGFSWLANQKKDELTLNYAAARALEKAGLYRRSVPYWQRVCALTDHSPEFMDRLKGALDQSGRPKEAKWIEKFLKRWERRGKGKDETDGPTPSPSAD